MSNEIATKQDVMSWVLDSGEKLEFAIEDARNISGNPNVTNKEFVLFSKLCAADKLNPYIKDAFLIKYGTSPAQFIAGKNAIMKIANRNKNYNGYEAGIVVLDKNNKIIHREGCIVYEDLGEKLIGGWGRVFKKDGSKPAYAEVSLKEYIGKKSDGSTNKQWREKPATMIRKVGFSQSHREACPEQLSNVYDESEIAAIENSREEKDLSAKEKVADIFSKKDEDVIDAEFEELHPEVKKHIKKNIQEYREEEENRYLANIEFLVEGINTYKKALEIDISSWLKKANVSKVEEMSEEILEKCYDYLKPKYEALKKKETKNDSVAQDVAETFGN